VRQQLVSQLQRPAKGIEGQFRFLSQVGITLGTKNQVNFNEAKFREAYERDPNAVKELFAGFEIQASTSSSPVDGVTIIEESKTIYKKLGFGDTFDQLLTRLTNTVDGATVVADRNFQKRIEQLNQRIKSIDDRIAAKRTRYERQFIAMETAIARVQSQQGAVAGISAIPSF
jgi:flagellar hook-associated protein 2